MNSSVAMAESLSNKFPKEAKPHKPKFTAFELRVIRLMMDGISNKEIAVRLERTANSINSQIGIIYEKLGVKGQRREAFIRVMQQTLDQGLLESDDDALKKKFPKFYELTPAEQSVALGIIRKKNIFEMSAALDLRWQDVQSLQMSLEAKCETIDRAGLLHLFYGDVSSAKLKKFHAVTNNEEYSILVCTLRGFSEAQIEQATGLNLSKQKIHREALLDKIHATSMEGVFAKVHGHGLPEVSLRHTKAEPVAEPA